MYAAVVISYICSRFAALDLLKRGQKRMNEVRKTEREAALDDLLPIWAKKNE